MQRILSDDHDTYLNSNLGVLSSCLIPECGHKHLYTMTKKDIDGLHKDKFHRLAPPSFTVSLPLSHLHNSDGDSCTRDEQTTSVSLQVSVLFDYIPTSMPSDLILSKKLSQTPESSSHSLLLLNPSEKSIDQSGLQENEHRDQTKDLLQLTNNNEKTLLASKSRASRSKQRSFALYANGMSDWDSTDSESGFNETSGNASARDT